jgi:hypothetical protein
MPLPDGMEILVDAGLPLRLGFRQGGPRCFVGHPDHYLLACRIATTIWKLLDTLRDLASAMRRLAEASGQHDHKEIALSKLAAPAAGERDEAARLTTLLLQDALGGTGPGVFAAPVFGGTGAMWLLHRRSEARTDCLVSLPAATEDAIRAAFCHNSSMDASLCETCRHLREVVTPKGSRFLLCQLSVSDPRFPRYPRQPVVRCGGYEGLDNARSAREKETRG